MEVYTWKCKKCFLTQGVAYSTCIRCGASKNGNGKLGKVNKKRVVTCGKATLIQLEQ